MDNNEKVLMYGWEFPPRISGGLGVACYAIVKELAKKDIDVTLVLPYTVTDTIKKKNVKIVSSVQDKTDELQALKNELGSNLNIKYAPIITYLHPYISSKDLTHLLGSFCLKDLLDILSQIALPDEIKGLTLDAVMGGAGKNISGLYGLNLLFEVLRYALIAGGLAKKVEHDVIHAHDWLTILAAIEAKKYSKKPLIFHVHALETDRSGLFVDKRIFAIEKYGMEQADKVITVSQYTKNIAVKYYGIDPEKIVVVHNGIYFDEMGSGNHMEKYFPMVLFLGRVTHQKGPSAFIDMAKKILEIRSDIQFVIAGAGDLLKSMIEKVAELRIGKNVHFMGFLDPEKVKRIFKLADVYVMPSVSEPFGLSPLEALAQNVPVVISKQSGVSEALKNVLVTDFWDVNDMATKVMALLEYKALRQTSLDYSSQEAKSLTWEKTAAKIIEVYKKAIKN